MYKFKYYEASPNVEMVANQSHSFFFPPMVSVSDSLTQSYSYEENDGLDPHLYFKNIDKDEKGTLIDVNELLDYTMLSDEECISIQMLFSELPNDKEYNLVQHIKTKGIYPNYDSSYNI